MRFDKSFDSLGFWIILQCIFSLFLIASWTVSSAHLRLEQEWSAELLDQNTHSIEVIARQNKYIYELERIIKRPKIGKGAPRMFLTNDKEK